MQKKSEALDVLLGNLAQATAANSPLQTKEFVESILSHHDFLSVPTARKFEIMFSYVLAIRAIIHHQGFAASESCLKKIESFLPLFTHHLEESNLLKGDLHKLRTLKNTPEILFFKRLPKAVNESKGQMGSITLKKGEKESLQDFTDIYKYLLALASKKIAPQTVQAEMRILGDRIFIVGSCSEFFCREFAEEKVIPLKSDDSCSPVAMEITPPEPTPPPSPAKELAPIPTERELFIDAMRCSLEDKSVEELVAIDALLQKKVADRKESLIQEILRVQNDILALDNDPLPGNGLSKS